MFSFSRNTHTSSSLLRDQEIYDERFMFAGCCLEYRERTEVQPTDARTCIVISLGTTYVNQQKAFYQKCLEAFGSLDMEIYMNIGRNIQPGELGYIPPNFILSSMLPQLSLLSKACLFITHGGANSTREALYYGVPMLIYPIDGDQFDVADRIVQLQCGEQYRPDSSSEQLYQQAMDVMENQTYSQNCFRMKQNLQQNGGCRIAAEAILKKIRRST